VKNSLGEQGSLYEIPALFFIKGNSMEKKQDRKTVGEIYLDAVDKNEHYEAEELRREMQKDWEKSVLECCDRGKKLFSDDFFIHVETKKERLTPNVIRNYFIPRLTCPQPFYDQTVYRYNRENDDIEFIWVIPSKDTCINYRENALLVDPEEKDLLNFILDFYDGNLHRVCIELNVNLTEEDSYDGRREVTT
jgi:hypothetical protein